MVLLGQTIWLHCQTKKILQCSYGDLNLFLAESFRMNPITGYLNRVCTIPYHIPGSDAVIEKGTSIVIPVWAVQNDSQHYPNPQSFIPERFSGNNFKPSPTYLPFGDGPRICIGQ